MAEPTTGDEFIIIDPAPAQPSMLTPQQITEAENIRAAQAASEPPAPAPAPTPAPAPAPQTPPSPAPAAEPPIATEEQLAMLDLKLRAGEELSDAEKAIVAKMEEAVKEAPPAAPPATPPAAPAPEKKYRIGSEELSASAIEAKMRAEMGLGDLKLADDSKTQMIEMYVKAANRSEAQVAVAKGYEANAAERNLLEQQRVLLEQTAQGLAEQMKRLGEQKKKMEADAQSSVTPETIYNEFNRVDVNALSALQSKMSATQQLPAVTQELAELEQKSRDTQKQIRVAMINEFIAVHPEYALKGDLVDVATKINRRETVDADDEIKVLELTEMLDEAATRGLNLDKVHGLRSRQNTLAVRPAAQTAPQPTLPKGDLPKPKPLAEVIASYRAKIAKAGPSVAAPSAPAPPSPPRTAAEVIARDRETLGMNTGDPFMREIGYS